MTTIRILVLAAASHLVWVPSAWAYIGPGAGITMLGALWAVILAIVLALGGLIIWPLRAYLRKKRRARGGEAPLQSPEISRDD